MTLAQPNTSIYSDGNKSVKSFIGHEPFSKQIYADLCRNSGSYITGNTFSTPILSIGFRYKFRVI